MLSSRGNENYFGKRLAKLHSYDSSKTLKSHDSSPKTTVVPTVPTGAEPPKLSHFKEPVSDSYSPVTLGEWKEVLKTAIRKGMTPLTNYQWTTDLKAEQLAAKVSRSKPD